MALFDMGQVVMTCGVSGRIADSEIYAFLVQKALQMHSEGNWGDVCDENWESNQNALRNGGRLFSVYIMSELDPEDKIWIITEEDRSATTVLLPEEY